jgi:hypothetical protein
VISELTFWTVVTSVAAALAGVGGVAFALVMGRMGAIDRAIEAVRADHVRREEFRDAKAEVARIDERVTKWIIDRVEK